MRKITTYSSTIAAACITSFAANAQPIKEALHILDVSTSAAIGIELNAARSAGNNVERSIRVMDKNGIVRLRTLGSAGIIRQQLRVDAKLGKKAGSRPRRVAAQLGSIVRAIPQLTASGDIDLQPHTNIIGHLETLSPSLDCQNRRTKIYLYTDGIESSSFVDSQELLSGKASLPAPSGEILKGCIVEMRGLAEQNSNIGTNNAWFVLLRKEWTRFFKSAGVSEFKAYADFE